VGGLSGLVPFTRVGTFAYIGGMARVVADVPPYMLVVGQPATVRGVNVIGLRRAGMGPADRRALQDAYRILYRDGISPRRAMERIREELPATPAILALLDFIGGARRGICGPPGHDDEAGLAVSGSPGDAEEA
jgi:UDP-N-acetylglucosamine acyltransferase